AGVTSFLVVERAASVGGTWRDNTYPGIACDVPSHLYGLESHPWPRWSRVFAPGAEIRNYLERVVESESLTNQLMLGTTMTLARWDGEAWRVTLDGDREVIADNLILAAGRLTEPRIP